MDFVVLALTRSSTSSRYDKNLILKRNHQIHVVQAYSYSYVFHALLPPVCCAGVRKCVCFRYTYLCEHFTVRVWVRVCLQCVLHGIRCCYWSHSIWANRLHTHLKHSKIRKKLLGREKKQKQQQQKQRHQQKAKSSRMATKKSCVRSECVAPAHHSIKYNSEKKGKPRQSRHNAWCHVPFSLKRSPDRERERLDSCLLARLLAYACAFVWLCLCYAVHMLYISIQWSVVKLHVECRCELFISRCWMENWHSYISSWCWLLSLSEMYTLGCSATQKKLSAL